VTGVQDVCSSDLEAEPSGLCDDEDDAMASIDDFVAGKLN